MSELEVLNKIQAANKQADDDFDKLVSSDLTYLPNIKLLQDGGKETKEKAHSEFFKPKAGDFIINKTVLGSKFDALICGWRSKAIAFVKGEKFPRVCYDLNDPKFKEVASHEKGSQGPEFLVWCPEAAAFGVMHMKGTAKNNAPSVRATQGGACLIYSDEIDGGEFSWYTILGRPGTWTPDANNLPTSELYDKAIALFNNPKTAEERQAEKDAKEEKAEEPKKKRKR